jgi:hypothetical protein
LLDVGAREKDASGKRSGSKQSVRWIEGYERLAELVPQLPATRLVYVADREADLLSLMARAEALGNPVDWLVRATHNRSLPVTKNCGRIPATGNQQGKLNLHCPPGPEYRPVLCASNCGRAVLNCQPAAEARGCQNNLARAEGCACRGKNDAAVTPAWSTGDLCITR